MATVVAVYEWRFVEPNLVRPDDHIVTISYDVEAARKLIEAAHARGFGLDAAERLPSETRTVCVKRRIV